MKKVILATVFLLALMVYGEEQKRIKFATLAPQSSAWGKCISSIAREVWKKTEKQVAIKIYYGAQMGDEKEMAEKIEVGQLDGAAFTGNGLAYVCREARVMELPFLFNSYEEIDYVYHRMKKGISTHFQKKGFRLLGYLDAGYAYFFSQADIKNFQDIRKSKMWIWKGDKLAEIFMEVLGIPAIAIGFTEVVPSLQTGLIDGFYCPPTAAISLQWHLEAGYLLDQPFCSVTSGLVLAEKVWQKLSPKEQNIFIQSIEKHVVTLRNQNRDSDKQTLELLGKKKEYQINKFDGDTQEFTMIREKIVKKMVAKGFFTDALYRQVQTNLKKYRDSL